LERVRALKGRLADAELAMQSVTRTTDESNGPARLSSQQSTPSGSDDDSGRQATHPPGSQAAAGLQGSGSSSKTSRPSRSSSSSSGSEARSSAGITEEEFLTRKAEQDKLLDALLGNITSRSVNQLHCI
jgi:hypothetical protein